jgi:hypothetical protein
MAMIIPSPKYKRVPYNLKGLSWWQQIIVVLRTPPQLEVIEDWISTLENGLRIIIPKGFVTDGASIPAWLWWLISPFGPLLEAAILHDFGYQHGYLLSPFDIRQVYNLASMRMSAKHADKFEEYGDVIPVFVGKGQQFFDDLLRHVTIEANGATVQANAAYKALRVFGHFAWDKYRKEGPGAFNSNSLGLPGGS